MTLKLPAILARVVCLLLAASPSGATPVHAQQVDDNPITAAENAFGTSIGGESIGVYQTGNVRGFSPIVAGNVRLEGLYFDQRATFTGRLVAGSTIHVGLSTLSYPFPAPTGIVDSRLRKPGDEAIIQIMPQANSFGGTQVEVDTRLPLVADRVGLAGGFGIYKHRYPDGGDSFVTSVALIPRWRPSDSIEVLPFWSRIDTRDMDVSPVFLVDGDHLPPEISRHRSLGQSWADIDRVRTNYGVVGTARPGEWVLRTGIFRSVEAPTSSFSLLFRDTNPAGYATLTAVADPPQHFASWSGEIRVSRSVVSGTRLHGIHFAIRGREQQRRYGGSHRVEIGPAQIGEVAPLPEPDFHFGPQTRDHVRHWTGGVAYEGRWTGVGELSLGVQKTDYRKLVTPPAGALPRSRDTPWLYNGTLAMHLSSRVALYGSYTQGLEESPVAPEVAANRDEAPPGIRTEQVDVGLRWEGPWNIRIIAGAFRVDKPYHALDSQHVFRRLGQQRRQGIELSLTGEPLPGLSIVAGTILMDASVGGEPVESDELGRRPVGSARTSIVANLEYDLASLPAVSFDLAIDRSGKRVANRTNTLNVPPVTLVDLGARYRFRVRSIHGILRLRATNLFDTYAWNVAASGTFSDNDPRQVTVRVAVEL